MSKPLFSVIVPTYGRPGFLAEAVASVLAQTVEDFECIVVDDASPEPARVSYDPRVRLIRRSRNGGTAAAFNTGIEQARGVYVTFLADDDLYTPDRLALALEGLKQAPIALCWSRYLHGPSEGGPMLRGDVRHTIADSTTPSLGVTAVRRSLVDRLDERFRAVEDVEWWLRRSAAAPVWTVPRYGYLVRRHKGPRHGNDMRVRIRYSLVLLRAYADYFSSHTRASAFRWKRIGLMAQQIGDHEVARLAFGRSLQQKWEFATLFHVFRSLRRSTASIDRKAELIFAGTTTE